MLDPLKKEEARVSDAAPVFDPSKSTGPNLLDNRALGGLIRSRWYPGILQWPTLAVFVAIMAVLLFGPEMPGENWGTAMTWVLWWPLIPIFFLLIGRFWCAICPFAAITDLVQRFVGNQRPVPRFLKKYGVWVITALFVLITWGDHVWGIVESPWGSGVLMLALTTGAVISGAFWQRRTWCRYICPLGGMSGNYARVSMLELRGTTETCKTCSVAACYSGSDKAPGCKLFEFPRTMDSNASCNMCGDCVKSCPNDSPRLALRVPTRELWFIRKPKMDESFLAIMIAGMVLVQNITMLKIWDDIESWLRTLTGTDSLYVNFTIPFVAAIVASVGLLLVASLVGRAMNGESVKQNFAKFGYAIIPIVMAGHMGHNLFHLLAEGKALGYTTASIFGAPIPGGSAALVDNSTLVILQFIFIVLGLAASLYTAYRIARTNYAGIGRTWATFVPYAGVLLVLAGVSIWLLKYPMAMRM